MELNRNFWSNKKVFITGHTGFKGTWLLILLLKLGAIVKGYSDKIEENSLFKNVYNQLSNDFLHTIGDIRDENNLSDNLERMSYWNTLPAGLLIIFITPIVIVISSLFGGFSENWFHLTDYVLFNYIKSS